VTGTGARRRPPAPARPRFRPACAAGGRPRALRRRPGPVRKARGGRSAGRAGEEKPQVAAAGKAVRRAGSEGRMRGKGPEG